MEVRLPNVLVVDDDPHIRRLLSFNLEADGFIVRAASTGQEALALLERGLPDLAIVDLLLPDMHGFDLSKKIKDYTDMPIIMLTAVGTEDSILEGLRDYAEDYIIKPFSYPQFLARVTRVLKRMQNHKVEQSLEVLGPDLTLDFARHVAIVQGNEVPLTPIEARLLWCLAKRANRVVQSDVILDEVWQDGEGDPERMWVHIRGLRQKIELDPAKPKHLLTHRGLGYSLAKDIS